MNNHLTNRGVWVRINRYKGETVEGWLIGEIPQGLLIALDKDLKDLRLVSEYYSISYNHENKLSTLSIENATEVRDELQAISEAISVPMKNAISRTKFDKLHQFCHHSAELSWQIRQGEHEAFQGIDSEPRGELMGFLLAQVDRSTALHREVYETFEDCGLTAILDEFGRDLHVYQLNLQFRPMIWNSRLGKR
ncbi:hypothetical protein [Crenothrix polyspora]|uniref:Uncharacterized protein n=1 Tax=Crenothrix polyspora TaxID=360316 RepID=A0A1R4HEJ5_9GAMM|nr:hypothetical protein [Crenothrix polyspora]SJM94626.1 hypothetical protein CRENPOLYSF1_560002 [Crenothrix polyspora]